MRVDLDDANEEESPHGRTPKNCAAKLRQRSKFKIINLTSEKKKTKLNQNLAPIKEHHLMKQQLNMKISEEMMKKLL